jgi:hypothetical protein
MDRVTYPSPEVQSVLGARYEHVKLDVAADGTEATAPFKPEVIPVAVILDADGLELSRHTGFATPEVYASWLESVPEPSTQE